MAVNPSIADSPENRDDRYFEIDGKGFRVLSLDDKRCITGVGLAVTECLLGEAMRPARHATARVGPVAHGGTTVRDVLAHDLKKVAAAQPQLIEAIRACESLVLERTATAAQAASRRRVVHS